MGRPPRRGVRPRDGLRDGQHDRPHLAPTSEPPRPFLLAGWAGARPPPTRADPTPAPYLDAALADAACGCALAARAAADADGTGDDLAAEADALAAAWRCPAAGHAAPADVAELPELQREAHRQACALVGAPLPPTCPRATLALPWVRRATRAYAWREKGALAAVEPAPPAALLEAVDVVAEGVAAAQARAADDASAAARRT